MGSKAKLPGLASFQVVEGWVLLVILGVYISRFVVGMDFFFSVLLHGMVRPKRTLQKGVGLPETKPSSSSGAAQAAAC